jgi:hypothetical protein
MTDPLGWKAKRSEHLFAWQDCQAPIRETVAARAGPAAQVARLAATRKNAMRRKRSSCSPRQAGLARNIHLGCHLFEKRRHFYLAEVRPQVSGEPLLFRLSLILFATRRLGEQPLGAG